MSSARTLIGLIDGETAILEHVVRRLIEVRAMLVAGEGEYLGRAAGQLDDAMDALAAMEILRDVVAAELAQELGLGEDASLLEIASSLDDQLEQHVLHEQREKLTSIATEAAMLRHEAESLAAAGKKLIEERVNKLPERVGAASYAPGSAPDVGPVSDLGGLL